MELSENEKALYAELVAQIAVRMGEVRIDRSPEEDEPREDRFDIKGRIIEHGHLGVFEAACAVLREAGAAQPLNVDETPHENPNAATFQHRIKFDLPGLREYMAGPLPESAPPLSDVIKSFLRLTAAQEREVSTQRDPFPVPPQFSRVFNLFARCGYVERAGDAVKWTARIAPEMRAIYAWTENDLSREELYDAEIERMWRTMPPRLREVFFSGGSVDVISLSAVIWQCWYDGRWQSTALDAGDPRISSLGGAIGKARDLAKRFSETGG